MNLSYHIKIHSKLLIRGVLVFALIALINNLFLADHNTWNLFKTVLIIIPMFFTANILSDEYEQSREGIVFVTRTPIYKQLMNRYLWSWFVSEAIISVIFLSAYMTNMEEYIRVWLVHIIYSTFLSFLGLTVSNVTRHTLAGYGTAFAYWVVQLAAGFKFNEVIMPLSVMINIQISYETEWLNLITLVLLSVVLACFNLWYVGKGENIRFSILMTTLSLFLALSVLAGGYLYYIYYQDTVQARVMNNEWGDTLYVISSANSDEAKYMENLGLQYKLIKDMDSGSMKGKNIVFIVNRQIGNTNLSDKNVEVIDNALDIDEDGVKIGSVSIRNACGYRVIAVNPFDSEKYIVLMEAEQWSEELLNLMFNEKKGNLLVIGEEKAIARSRFDFREKGTLTEHIADNLEILDQGAWITRQKDGAQLDHKHIRSDKAQEILDIWSVVSQELEKFAQKVPNKYIMALCYEDEASNVKKDVFLFVIDSKKDFEITKNGGRDWAREITSQSFAEILFGKLEDENLRNVWSDYLMRTRVIPILEKNIGSEYWKRNYDVPPGEYVQSYKEQIEKTLDKKEGLDRDDMYYIGAYMMHIFEESPNKLAEIIKEIYSAKESVSNAELKKIFYNYLNTEKVDSIFLAYDKAKKYADAYKTVRWVISQ